MKKVTEYLRQLGLTEIEANLYQTLLQTGPTTVKDLADRAGVKRITAHFNIESLISKGLVTQTMEGARRKIIAESPDKIDYLIEQKEKEIVKLKTNYDAVTNTLKSLSHLAQEHKEVHIKYYSGKHAVRLVYKDIVQSNEIRSYVNSVEVGRIFPENFELFSKAHRLNKSQLSWEIIKRPPNIDKYISSMDSKRYFFKFVPDNIDLSIIDYMIYDGKVAIVNIKEDATAIVILNDDYYQNAKAIFDLVWQVLK